MNRLEKVVEQQIVNVFKLGMLDALGGKNKPDPMPAVKEAVRNILNAAGKTK